MCNLTYILKMLSSALPSSWWCQFCAGSPALALSLLHLLSPQLSVDLNFASRFVFAKSL